MRKDAKAMKKILTEVNASIFALEALKAVDSSEWVPHDEASLVLLRCFKYVFEHNL